MDSLERFKRFALLDALKIYGIRVNAMLQVLRIPKKHPLDEAVHHLAEGYDNISHAYRTVGVGNCCDEIKKAIELIYQYMDKEKKYDAPNK